MMARSFVWTTVFVVLVAELVLVVLLCLPLPWGIRKFTVKLVGSAKGIEHIRTAMVFVLLCLTMAFISSIQEVQYATEKASAYKFELNSASGYEVWEFSKLRQEKFRGERNMYLSLFCLTLSLVLHRLLGLFANEMDLRNQIEGKPASSAPSTLTSIEKKESADGKKGN